MRLPYATDPVKLWLAVPAAYQDVAYSTKTLAAREMALRASLEMLTPSGSCEKGGGEQSCRPRSRFPPLPARPPGAHLSV